MGAPVRIPVLALALGMYLPFSISMGIFSGAALSYVSKYTLKVNGAAKFDISQCEQRGLLYATGLIVGEAVKIKKKKERKRLGGGGVMII